jgi:hypothetical protein
VLGHIKNIIAALLILFFCAYFSQVLQPLEHKKNPNNQYIYLSIHHGGQKQCYAQPIEKILIYVSICQEDSGGQM